ncbi:hypothetical protein [Pseudomonas sp.]|uniref:hypothetical protein n=1 Tax=Pseudomonas sp. TaxID=306 RepID=UPI0028AFDF0B|nr:hypothetical protein [Pseudomonas sp.]
MQYEHPSGLRTGVNVQSASRTAVDYADTFYAPSSYTLFGANVGFEPPNEDWKVSLYVKTLANDKDVTAIQSIYNVNGQA